MPPMASPQLEGFLARLYVDAPSRDRFLADPDAEARAAGLDEDEVAALRAIDRAGLALAAASFERKRDAAHPRPVPWWRRMLR